MEYIEQKVMNYAVSKNMLSDGDRIIVGVSGGADSVCLLVWLSRMRKSFNLDIIGVHVHHGIRGGEADRDMQFTVNLCESLGIECVVRSFDVPLYAKQNKLSEEEAGRRLRYDTFNELLLLRQFNKIAVAHHSEDSAETILFNMIRGSRAKGLKGIAPVNGNIIRPLMCLTRSEIEEYLHTMNTGWCTDSTNASEEYSRNRIRETIIPAMMMINSGAIRHILETGEFIGQLYDYLEKNVEELYTGAVTEKGQCFRLGIGQLTEADRLIRLELFKSVIERLAGSLKDITSAHIEAVEELLYRQSGRRLDLPYNIEAIREHDIILMRKRVPKQQDDSGEESTVIKVDTTKEGSYVLPYGVGMLHVRPFCKENANYEEKSLKFVENICTKFMDCDRIEDILTIRTRRPGDYLLVNKGQSKKKLKEYFIDSKIPVSERDGILLLAEGSHILWILGHRMGDGGKLSSDTKRCIEFRWEKNNTEEEKYECKD